MATPPSPLTASAVLAALAAVPGVLPPVTEQMITDDGKQWAAVYRFPAPPQIGLDPVLKKFGETSYRWLSPHVLGVSAAVAGAIPFKQAVMTWAGHRVSVQMADRARPVTEPLAPA